MQERNSDGADAPDPRDGQGGEAQREAARSRSQEEQAEEEESVSEASRLSARLIYEVVRRDGEDELTRPTSSLIFSGLAAGILIAFSMIGQAVLRAGLPDTEWRLLVDSLGYSFGFLLVILGRMQLFTENTITTVLPLMGKPCRAYFYWVLRLWAIVLAANLVGAFIAAAFLLIFDPLPADVTEAMVEISRHATSNPPFEAFAKALPAGVLIAAIVWMIPTMPHNPLPVILVFTWLIAAGDFTHVIAGSVEMALLLLDGELPVMKAIFAFFLPVLAGNVVGGTAVFTMITWAQVKNEVEHS